MPENSDVQLAFENIMHTIEASVPESIAEQLQFAISVDQKYVTVKLKKRLEQADFVKVNAAVRANMGEYISAGTDSHFRVPLNPNDPTQAPPPSAVPAAVPQTSAPSQKPRPSPVQQFFEGCTGCEAKANPCTPQTEMGQRYMKLCIEVLKLNAIRALKAVPPAAAPKPAAAKPPAPAGPRALAPPAAPKPDYEEDGIVWSPAVTNGGKPCEKAWYSKQTTNNWDCLLQELQQKKTKGEQLVINSRFHWFVDQAEAPYIGRMLQEKKKQ